MKGFALPRPPDPRLGSLPNHPRHGMALSRSALDSMLTPHRFSWASYDITSSFSSNPRLKSNPWKPSENSELSVVVTRAKRQCLVSRRALVRSQILRATSSISPVPPQYYKSISRHLSDAFAAGTFLKDGPPKGDAPANPPNPMDPAAMDGMMAGMKTQMVMMVPQMVIMGWINFFFQGFILSESRRRKTFPRLKIYAYSKTAFSFDAGFQVYVTAGN